MKDIVNTVLKRTLIRLSEIGINIEDTMLRKPQFYRNFLDYQTTNQLRESYD